MVEYHEFMVFSIEDSGDKNQINIEKEELNFYLHPEKTIIIVREELRRIYLWKGAKSTVRKRFLSSRVATEIQGELMKNGFHRCKVISVDQGDEVEEFLNVFGLESMKVSEKLEDKVILRNSERDRLEQQRILDTKIETSESSKLGEIKKLLDGDESMIWIKSTTLKITKDWLNSLVKNKKYKKRIKKLGKLDNIEEETFEKRDVITNKRLLTNNRINEFYDFSGISVSNFHLQGKIAILNLKGLRAFDIEESKGIYNIWFHAEPENEGDYAFLFEGLTTAEYYKIIDIFTGSYIAEIPKQAGKLTYIQKN